MSPLVPTLVDDGWGQASGRRADDAETYWRDGPEEADFVVSHGERTWAIEVKSGRRGRLSGMASFHKSYPKAEVWLVGAECIPLTEFFARPAPEWFRQSRSEPTSTDDGVRPLPG